MNKIITTSFTQEEMKTGNDNRFVRMKVWIANVGENYNNSSFSKEALIKMSATLPGIPITAYIGKNKFSESDFRGHEEELVYLGNDEYGFNYLGYAYGFVPVDCNAKFETKACPDGVTREYLTAEVLIWTKWKQVSDIFSNSDWIKSQSMEIEDIKGDFEEDNIFHIEDARFSALCILGDDVSPGIPYSTIEKFSFSSLKFQFNEMFNQYAENKDNTITIPKKVKETIKTGLSFTDKLNKINAQILSSARVLLNEDKVSHSFIGKIKSYQTLITGMEDEEDRNIYSLILGGEDVGEWSMVMNFLKKEDWGTSKALTIDTSKESADTNTSWGDVDKTKLRNDILKASNYKTLVKTAYLEVLDGWEDSPSENLKYPVCLIKKDKLVLSSNGCQAALSRLHGQGITSGSVVNKLKKYYKKLGLDTSSFSGKEDEKLNKEEVAAKFSLTTNQMYEELNRVLCECKYESENWAGEKVEREKYWMNDYDENFVYVTDRSDKYKDYKIPYSMSGDNPVMDYEGAKRVKYVAMDWEEQEGEKENEDMNFAIVIEDEAKQEFQKAKQTIMEKSESLLELTEKYTLLENQLKEANEKLEQYSSLEESRAVKEKEEKVAGLIEEFSKKIVMNSEEVENFKEQSKNFSKFEDFAISFKAQMTDRVLASVVPEGTAKFSGMGIDSPLPKEKEPKLSDGNDDPFALLKQSLK